MKLIKRTIEFFLFVIILGQLALFSYYKNNPAAQSEAESIQNIAQLSQVKALMPAEMPMIDLPSSPYEQAQLLKNPEKLQRLAQNEAEKMVSTGDVSAFKAQLQRSNLINISH